MARVIGYVESSAHGAREVSRRSKARAQKTRARPESKLTRRGPDSERSRANESSVKMGQLGPTPGASRLTDQEALQLQSVIGNSAVSRIVIARSAPTLIQRNDTATALARFGPYAPETYANLYNIARTLASDLEVELEEVEPDAPEMIEAREWLDGVRAWLPHLSARSTGNLDPIASRQAEGWYRDLERIRQRLRDYKRRRIEQSLSDARRRLSQLAAQLRERRPELDESMRAAFLSQDENAIAQVANFVGNALDIGLGISELSRQMAEAIAQSRGMTIPSASRYAQWLDKVNRVLAAANLLYSVANMDAPSELNEAMNEVNTLAGAFSAGGTLLGLAPHIGLYSNLYLVPLVQVITSRLGPLLDRHLHQLNVVAAHTGFSVEMSSEPGGWPMFFFMASVMRGRSSDNVPWPIPSAVGEYLLEWRDQFGAGTQQDLPTTGAWFWRSLDDSRIKDWIFGNRRRIWAMLYGSMPLPNEASIDRARRRAGN